MKPSILLFFMVVLFSNCQTNLEKTDNKKNEQKEEELIASFEQELNALNKRDIKSLDKAAALFQKHVNKTADVNQKDVLYQPYYMFYNLGRNLLINEEQKVAEKYGFIKKERNGKAYLVATDSEYLEANVIKHLSEPMQQLCHQQLKEFDEAKDLETVANNAIWWGNFNEKNPNFHLKEMTDYYYKSRHLKNLLLGTKTVPVFTKENQLSDEAISVYENILKKHSQTETAKIVNDYLTILKKSNGKKTGDAIRFFTKNIMQLE